MANDKPEGRYTNFFKIGYNAYEFVLDFQQFYPENGEVRDHTRLITGPAYIKEFLNILQKSVHQFEKNFGPIDSGE